MIPYSIKANDVHRLLRVLLSNTISVGSLSHLMACFWIRINGILTSEWVNDYINGLYFIFTTSSTVGYGDNSVDHKAKEHIAEKYLFGCVLMLMALIFFAYIQSLITTLIADYTAVGRMMNAQLEEFSDWMAARNQTKGVVITYKYEATLREFINYLTTHDLFSAISASGFLDSMSYRHQQRVIESATLYISSSLSLFDELSQHTTQEVVMNLTPVRYAFNDIAMKRVKNF